MQKKGKILEIIRGRKLIKQVLLLVLILGCFNINGFSLPEGYNESKYEDLTMAEKTGLMVSIRKHFLKKSIIEPINIEEFKKSLTPVINGNIFTVSLPTQLSNKLYSFMLRAQKDGNNDRVIEIMISMNAWVAVMVEYALENSSEKIKTIYIKKTSNKNEAYIIERSKLVEFKDELSKLVKESDEKSPEFDDQSRDIVFKLVKNIVKPKS